MKKSLLPLLLLLLCCCKAFANPPELIKKELRWAEELAAYPEEGADPVYVLRFDGAVYDEKTPGLPYFSQRFSLDSYGEIQATFQNVVYESFSSKNDFEAQDIPQEVQITTAIEQDRLDYFGRVSFLPIRKTAEGQYERVVYFELRLSFRPLAPAPPVRGGNTFTSVLSSGSNYKLAVTQPGVYKLDYNFLKSKLGLPVDNLDPRELKLYGNGGGALPELAGAPRPDDLVENAILVYGEEDGKFDNGDYVLFHAQGPAVLQYNPSEETFSMPANHYDTRNYYFLQISAGNGLRIQNQPSIPPGGGYQVSAYDDYVRYERELYNLQHDWAYGQGSGRQFFGDYFKFKNSDTYSQALKRTGLVAGEPAKISAAFAGRVSSGGGSWFSITVNGQQFNSSTFSTTKGGSTDTYAHLQSLKLQFTPVSDENEILLSFNRPANNFNEGWLDFIDLNVRRQLRMEGLQLYFRDTRSANFAESTFLLQDALNTTEVWDVTDPLRPLRQETSLNGGQLSFSLPTAGVVREFVAFASDGLSLEAEPIGKIDNQNYHGIDNVDLTIVYHADFKSEAERLADHRRNFSGLEVTLVDVEKLYNEFSSGRKDVSAIRDFAKMLFDRNPQRFKSLLLFGDGSFDSRDIYGLGGDFVPVYETSNSLSPIYSFPSDDYFALLGDSEGADINTGSLDIGVGRIPVKTAEEARQVVDKIIHYDTHNGNLRDWRNRIVFVGDDEDGNLHTADADKIAVKIGGKNPNLNVDKIYLDAFPQVSTYGGARIPLATEAINNNMFKGALAMVYLGHGGAKGWAQERVLKTEDIQNWNNFDKMPIIITATCSFSGYDDPGFTSAGELSLLNGKGGAIALYTTVRPVFASANKELTEDAVDTLFYKFDHEKPTFGEVLRLSKNNSGSTSNSRKFTLLGDPSQKLALPVLNVVTTKINGREVSQVQADTMRALQKVTVEGEVQDDFGNLIADFNGIVYPTVFDKKINYRTLAQDPGSPPFDFSLQKNIIFKGRASVNAGKFSFTFVVPKDINYEFGDSKISYYAADEAQMKDAAGNYQNLSVGGTDAAALSDSRGPRVDVFMNNESFVFGGITGQNPVLFVKLQDDNGINIVGNSIGHDLTGVLNRNTRNTYLLNDFYEAALDDYTRGEVRYPLYSLPEGRHEIKVTAWDIANNPAEGFTEFVVVSSEEVALRYVLNYPNPFTDRTCFMFEHNVADAELDVTIQIFSISGRLIKTLQERIISTGFRLGMNDCIPWDGRDDFGDPLARGVYLYKVKVRSANAGDAILSGESEYEKLVILK